MALEAASALARLGDPTGRPALERLTYSEDPKSSRNRRRDRRWAIPRWPCVLVRMLDDHCVGVARAALVNLPEVVGRDVAEASDGALLGTTEQIRRWKQWGRKRRKAPTTLRGAEAARSIYRLWSSKRPLMPRLLPWRPKARDQVARLLGTAPTVRRRCRRWNRPTDRQSMRRRRLCRWSRFAPFFAVTVMVVMAVCALGLLRATDDGSIPLFCNTWLTAFLTTELRSDVLPDCSAFWTAVVMAEMSWS